METKKLRNISIDCAEISKLGSGNIINTRYHLGWVRVKAGDTVRVSCDTRKRTVKILEVRDTENLGTLIFMQDYEAWQKLQPKDIPVPSDTPDVKEILREIMQDRFKEQYPTASSIPDYENHDFEKDYYPLDMVEEACKRYHEMLLPVTGTEEELSLYDRALKETGYAFSRFIEAEKELMEKHPEIPHLKNYQSQDQADFLFHTHALQRIIITRIFHLGQESKVATTFTDK